MEPEGFACYTMHTMAFTWLSALKTIVNPFQPTLAATHHIDLHWAFLTAMSTSMILLAPQIELSHGSDPPP